MRESINFPDSCCRRRAVCGRTVFVVRSLKRGGQDVIKLWVAQQGKEGATEGEGTHPLGPL